MSPDRVLHPDGHPLRYIRTWALVRALDTQLHLSAPYGRLLVKVHKGRVAGFEATQVSLWEAGEVTEAA